MNDDELAEMYKRAASIAASVPQSMQSAAFLHALDALSEGMDASLSKRTSPPKVRGRKASRRPAKAQTLAETKKRTRARTGSSSGPRSLVESLIDSGWFSSPRTVADTCTHLNHKQGIRYATSGLSPIFTRLLRDGRLDRHKDESGPYVYIAVD